MDEIRAMRVFERVAGRQSFAAAARELNISSTAASRHVNDLEEHLGVRLLNRTTRRISLTDIGESYLERARHILDDLDDLTLSARGLTDTPSGRLRVTTGIALGVGLISDLMPEFLRQYPMVNVELDLSNTLKDLVSDGFDLAIRSGPMRDSSLIQKHLFSSRLLIVANPQFLAQGPVPHRPVDLKACSCVVDQSTTLGGRWEFNGPRGRETIDVVGRYRANTFVAARAAILAGTGIGLLPDYSCAQDIADGRLVEILPEYTLDEDPTYALYPHRKFLSANVKAFVDYLQDMSQPRVHDNPEFRDKVGNTRPLIPKKIGTYVPPR